MPLLSQGSRLYVCEEPELAPTAAVEATRAQEMFVIGTSWPTASKVGASATKPTNEGLRPDKADIHLL